MVQVHLDLPQTCASQLGEWIEEFWAVLFAREEESVLRGLPVGVAIVARQRRVAVGPCLHARTALGGVHVVPQWLMMVTKREKQMAPIAKPAGPCATHPMPSPTADPRVQIPFPTHVQAHLPTRIANPDGLASPLAPILRAEPQAGVLARFVAATDAGGTQWRCQNGQ